MRTQTIELYTFSELSDDAKEVAREWYRNGGVDYFWIDEGMKCVFDFVRTIGGTDVSDYSICPFGRSYIDTNATHQNFRGMKLRSIDKDAMPNGYCLECTLYGTFYREFERTGDAFYAFKESLDEAAREMQRDWEFQYTDEAVDEMLTINEYEFTENGKIY